MAETLAYSRHAVDLPPPFELPEPGFVVTRKPSAPSAMSEAVSISRNPSIIRRLSNKASNFAGRRRQSSTTGKRRDHSSGPVIMRRRSDSTNTAPEPRSVLLTESDDELAEESKSREDSAGANEIEINGNGSANQLINNPNDLSNGPVIPSVLLQGTPMLKVSKKKKKMCTFTLDIDAAKVTWDKNRPLKAFYIDDIKEIRTGADASNYRAEFGVPACDEGRFFSILYAVPEKSKGKAQKLMHVIAGDSKTFELWRSTLDAISKHRHDLMASLSSFNDRPVRTYWRREMDRIFKNKPHSEDDEVIDLVGVERLCRSLHIHGVYNHLCHTFKQADISNTGYLSFSEFQGFINLMKRRTDIRSIFESIVSIKRKGLSLDQFLCFLQNEQGEDIENGRDHWEALFAKFVRKSKTKEQAQRDLRDGEESIMNEAALASYLTSTYNLPLSPTPATFTLDRPLNEYFISSSHNTYLTGIQVAGRSSVEAYISALCKGCRSVEVDCWDGNEGPVVTHGGTFTSEISFNDVMNTISKYAFVKSQWPLVISLEVHCTPSQQAMMAEIIKSTCGSKLVTEPLDLESQQLPSPSQLMNRILIKVKLPRADESSTPERVVGRQRGASLNSPYTRLALVDNGLVQTSTQTYSPPISPRQRPAVTSGRNQPSRMRLPSTSEVDVTNSTSESESMAEEGFEKKKQSNIVRVLGELGVYAGGVKFQGFDAAESKLYNHIYSFMESTFAKHSKTPETKRMLVRHNMRYMMRVYPGWNRISSTNFDPLMYWRRGVQMAALNWQTYDLGMQLNDAMFAAGTDVSGYVLKPSNLREITMLPAGEGHTKRERKIVQFSIDVISAQQLMRPRSLPHNRTMDPYVEVELYHADDKTKGSKGVSATSGSEPDHSGSSGIGTPCRLRTQIVHENGFNPVFNKQFQFDLTTKYPDLVFVRFTVRASRDGHSQDNTNAPPLAVYTAKLCSLKQGYRTLPLMDNNGDQFLFSTLFCRIKVHPIKNVYVDAPIETINKLSKLGRAVRSLATQTQSPLGAPKLSSEPQSRQPSV